MDDLGLLDYYEALFNEPEARVHLDGGDSLDLQRPALGRYYQLQHLSRQIQQSDLEDRVRLFRQWLQAAGVDPAGLTLADLVRISAVIHAMTVPMGRMAWDFAPSAEPDRAPRAVDYTGRELARIVHLLARTYGWSLDQIINLPREVALAHAQECILADRRQREWSYYLSDVAWEWDKDARVNRYRPMPALPWEMAPDPRRPAGVVDDVPDWIKEKYYPKGVVIDLADPEVRKKMRTGGIAPPGE